MVCSPLRKTEPRATRPVDRDLPAPPPHILRGGASLRARRNSDTLARGHMGLCSSAVSSAGSMNPSPRFPSPSLPLYGMPASWHRNARDGAATCRVRRCFGTGADAGAGALRRGFGVSARARNRRVCGAVGAGGQSICRVTACGITPTNDDGVVLIPLASPAPQAARSRGCTALP